MLVLIVYSPFNFHLYNIVRLIYVAVLWAHQSGSINEASIWNLLTFVHKVWSKDHKHNVNSNLGTEEREWKKLSLVWLLKTDEQKCKGSLNANNGHIE